MLYYIQPAPLSCYPSLHISIPSHTTTTSSSAYSHHFRLSVYPYQRHAFSTSLAQACPIHGQNRLPIFLAPCLNGSFSLVSSYSRDKSKVVGEQSKGFGIMMSVSTASTGRGNSGSNRSSSGNNNRSDSGGGGGNSSGGYEETVSSTTARAHGLDQNQNNRDSDLEDFEWPDYVKEVQKYRIPKYDEKNSLYQHPDTLTQDIVGKPTVKATQDADDDEDEKEEEELEEEIEVEEIDEEDDLQQPWSDTERFEDDSDYFTLDETNVDEILDKMMRENDENFISDLPHTSSKQGSVEDDEEDDEYSFNRELHYKDPNAQKSQSSNTDPVSDKNESISFDPELYNKKADEWKFRKNITLDGPVKPDDDEPDIVIEDKTGFKKHIVSPDALLHPEEKPLPPLSHEETLTDLIRSYVKDHNTETLEHMEYFKEENLPFMTSWAQKIYQEDQHKIFIEQSEKLAVRGTNTIGRHLLDKDNRRKDPDMEGAIAFDYTPKEVAFDYNVPVEMITDMMLKSGVEQPIDLEEKIITRMPINEIQEIISLLNTFDSVDLCERYSDYSIEELMEIYNIEYHEVKRALADEQIYLAQGIHTRLAKDTEKVVLDKILNNHNRDSDY